MMSVDAGSRHLRLTSHTGQGQGAAGARPIRWSATDPLQRGPVVGTTTHRSQRNVAGTHSGSCGVYRALAVAGVQGIRFQDLKPDMLHWLGVRRIHRLVSMSNDKFDAITGSGIEVGERMKVPDGLIQVGARMAMEAKIAAGCFTDGGVLEPEARVTLQGRRLD